MVGVKVLALRNIAGDFFVEKTISPHTKKESNSRYSLLRFLFI